MKLLKAWNLYGELGGRLSFLECLWLNKMGSEHKEILEIGSYKGKSTCFMSYDCFGSVVAIDPHILGTKDIFEYNINRYSGVGFIIPKYKTSQKAFNELKNNAFDFIFIDGDHNYKAVKQDYELYYSLLTDGGVIAFHDSRNRRAEYGPQRLVRELKRRHKKSGHCRSITYFTKGDEE